MLYILSIALFKCIYLFFFYVVTIIILLIMMKININTKESLYIKIKKISFESSKRLNFIRILQTVCFLLFIYLQLNEETYIFYLPLHLFIYFQDQTQKFTKTSTQQYLEKHLQVIEKQLEFVMQHWRERIGLPRKDVIINSLLFVM